MENSNVVKIERPAYNYTKFKDEFEVKDVAVKGKTVRSCLNECLEKRHKPSKKYMKEQLFRRLPFLNIIRTYRLKFLLRDVLSGLTVGVIQIAPTMANSTTANLPPINGLYVAFFSVIAYLLFGTSRHLSMGTHGVISIMVGNTIKNYEGILYPDKSNSSSDNYLSDNPTEAKILIAMTLAFIVGIIQLFLGLINAGFISKYMSDTMIEAFTIGSSYLIVVSQIGALLGIEVHRLKLPFKLIDNLIGIFADIVSTNWATVIISVLSITSIYLVKKYINDRYKKKLPAPIPIELIVVVIATLLAHFLQFGTRYNVSLVGPVPLGIPSPRFPPIRIFSTLFFSSFSIALVSFALNISMAKFFATKFNYPLDINQDLFAYGVGNILSGVFSGLPAAGGLTRTLIVETSGAKSQVYSLVSSVFVLVVILGLGSLFKELPECCLAAIIVTALIHKCFEVTKFFKLFKKSKAEAIVWLSTFAGVMILDVDYGLYIGLGVSVLTIVAKNQLATASVLGNIPETDFFEPISTNSKAKEIERVKIIRYEDSIYYVNAENFFDCVVKLIGVEKPIELLEELHLIELEYNNRADKQIQINFELNTIDKDVLKRDLINKRGDLIDKLMLDHVVLDMSSVNFIDSMGVNQLDKLNKLLKKLEISLHLTYVKSPVFKVMTRYGLMISFDLEHIYPTNSDALVFIRNYSRADETSNSSTIISHIV